MWNRVRLGDVKTDVFIAANVLDASFTFLALDAGGPFTELNGIIYLAMSRLGLGPTMLLKVILTIAVIWMLRTTRKEYLLFPLSAFVAFVASYNFLLLKLA